MTNIAILVHVIQTNISNNCSVSFRFSQQVNLKKHFLHKHGKCIRDMMIFAANIKRYAQTNWQESIQSYPYFFSVD